MDYDVYETCLSRTFICIPHGAEISVVPEEVQKQHVPLKLWKTIPGDRKTIGINNEQVQRDIAAQGYAITKSEVRTTIEENPKNPQLCEDESWVNVDAPKIVPRHSRR